MAVTNYKDRYNAEKLIEFKDNELKKLNMLILEGIESNLDEEYKRASLITYWIQDFNKYLVWEKHLIPIN